MFEALLLSFVLGFGIAAGTSLLLSPKKAARLPGGSLSAGLVTGLNMTHDTGIALLCAVAGLVGWFAFIKLIHTVQTARVKE